MKKIKLWSIGIFWFIGLLVVYGVWRKFEQDIGWLFFGSAAFLFVISVLLAFNFSRAQAIDKAGKKPDSIKSSTEEIKIPDEIYRQVHEELKAKKGDSALRAKAIIQSDGDNSRVKGIYIQLRAESIMAALENEKKIKPALAESPQKKTFTPVSLIGAAVSVIVLLVFMINKIEKPTSTAIPPPIVENVIVTEPGRRDGNTEKLNKALELYLQERYVEALPLFQQQAEQGSPIAQFSLGLMYGRGRGVAQDYNQAVAWFHRAADLGDIPAQNNLGAMYSEGLGVAKDYNQAVAWYRKAAEQGDAQAQNNLGSMYNRGLGVELDDKQAVAWFLKAAEQGYASAQFNLAQMYRNGLGVNQDDKQAIIWYRKAAEQGVAGAQYNLGVAYAKGWGVEQDDEQADIWFRKAAKQGQESAIATLKEREQL
jgi:TPR repeat protein